MILQRQIRQFGEFILLCLGFSIIPFLPRSCVVGLSEFLGDAAYRFSGKLRKISFANLSTAYGSDLSIEQKEDIVRGSFRTFSLDVLDLFWFGVFTKKRVSKYVQLDESFDFYLKEKACITVGAHFGNWEVLGLAFALKGSPNLSVAAPLDNSVADKILNRVRRKTGQKIVPREGAVREIIKTLKKGGKTGLLLDQNVLPENGGEFVDFFGLPVPISKVAASFSGKTGAEIVFVYAIADGRGVYKGYIERPFVSAETEIKDDQRTQEIAKTIEEVIRKYPDKWLWSYRRWKFVPKDAPADKYPFYSKAYPLVKKDAENKSEVIGG